MTGLPILTFHALDDRRSALSFPPELFARGLRRLHREGFRALTVSQAARCVQEQRPWPERALVITFDDGYASVFSHGLPILQELGYSATVFLTAGPETGHDLAPMEGRPRLSWTLVRELHRAGVEIGAHTMTHADLTRLGADRIEEEALGSRTAIEARIEAGVTSFAYPYGFHNALVREMVGRHFDCACAGELGLVTFGNDLLALPRVETHYVRHHTTFGLVGGPLLPSYLALRRTPRRLRQWAVRQAASGASQ